MGCGGAGGNRRLARTLGPVDRAIRILFGRALLALVWTGAETPWTYVGLVPLLTGASGALSGAIPSSPVRPASVITR